MQRKISEIRGMLRTAGPFPYLEEAMLKASHDLGFAMDDLEVAEKEAAKNDLQDMANRMNEIRILIAKEKRGLDDNLALAEQWGVAGPLKE